MGASSMEAILRGLSSNCRGGHVKHLSSFGHMGRSWRLGHVQGLSLADGKVSEAHDKVVKVAITAAELVFQAEDVGTRKGEIGG